MRVEDLEIALSADTGAASQLTKALKEVSAAANKLSGQIDEVGSSTKKASGIVDQYGNAVSSAAQDNEKASQSAERVASSMDDAASSMRRTADQSAVLGRRGGRLNNIVFSMGDAIQDAQFGIKGAGNNIAFMAEEMAAATATAGSFTAVLKGIGASILGVGGIILAVQTLLVFGPKLVQMFKDWASGATEAEKAMREVAKAADIVDTGVEMPTFEGEEIGMGLETVEVNLQQFRGEAEKVRARLEELRSEYRKSVRAASAFDNPIKRNAELQKVYNSETAEAIQVQSQYLDQIESEIARQEELQGKLEEANTQRQAEIEYRKFLQRMGAGPTGDEEELPDAPDALQVRGDFRSQINPAKRLAQMLERMARAQGRLNKLHRETMRIGPPRRSDATRDERLFETFSTRSIRDLIGTEALNTPRQVEAAIAELQHRLNNVPFGDKETRAQIQGLIRDLQSMGKQSASVKEQMDAMFAQTGMRALSDLSSGLGDLINPMVKVEDAAERMKRAFSRAISQMISDLIRFGAIRLATTIFGGPAGAATSVASGLPMASVQQPSAGPVQAGQVSRPSAGSPMLNVSVGVEDVIVEGDHVRYVLRESSRQHQRGRTATRRGS